MQFLAGILVVCPLVSALAFVPPRVTPVADAIWHQLQGWSPRPTEPPIFNVELLKRQSSSSLTLIEGPDVVCGYQFGEQVGYLELCDTSTCGFATGLDQDGEIFCYGSTTSAPRWPWTSCLAGIYAVSCLEDSACSDNPGIALCTVSTEPYCNVGTFIGLGVEVVWCDSTYYTGGSMVLISTTYTGQIGRVFTNPVSITTPSAPVSHSTPTPISTITHPSSSSTLAPTSQPKSPTPAGPIVGGVIGGLALIAAIAAGIFFCLHQNRKDKQTIITAPVQTYTQSNDTHPQYLSDKYPATVGATFIPTGYPSTSTKPEQQIQYQQPLQPQHQQPPPIAQPSYTVYHPPQQQSPPPTGNYQQPLQQPVQQTQQHYPQHSQPRSHSPPVQPQPQLSSLDAHRGSVASSISAPGSPTPPSYTSKIPAVPEMTSEASHHASPIDDRYEMPI